LFEAKDIDVKQATDSEGTAPVKHGALASPTPPRGAAADWTVPQHWEELTAEDHWVWDTLFARQQTLLHGRAVEAFQEGLDVLHLSRPGVPNFDELNEKLGARTGWTVVAVPGLVPDDVFFDHLSKRRFPAGNFIRQARQLDYLEEPDVFHDVFGHVPLLAQPAVADFMQALGELGLQALEKNALHRLARLYWYTVEFGLARENGDLKIYGAGILSSFGESHYSLESAKPHRLGFDLERVLRTSYRTDTFQQSYFVIDRFEDVLKLVQRNDFARLYEKLETLPDISPAKTEKNERLAA
jgi:phenylalanine-4-hydroxylase